jgi:peptidoglycan/xylan/chitin deacetylase (PgdA/CDA1 family)
MRATDRIKRVKIKSLTDFFNIVLYLFIIQQNKHASISLILDFWGIIIEAIKFSMKKIKYKINSQSIKNNILKFKSAKLPVLFFLAIILIILVIVGGYHKTDRKIKGIFITALSPSSSKEIIRGDTNKKQVIFTFDGGADIESADKILDVLEKHHIKGTFFLTGKTAEANPGLVKKIAVRGNEIFSHTYDHPYLTTLSDKNIDNELEKTEKVLLEIAGLSPKPYFRAPYGDRNVRVLAAAAKFGYQSVYWTVDALDWMESNGETAEQVRERILSSLAPGNIYLMHLGDNITGKILDDVFSTIEMRGYKIVSLTQGI